MSKKAKSGNKPKGKEKPNPRKIPRTEEDCKRAYAKGLDDGMKHMTEIILFCLADKHDVSKEEMKSLAGDINYLCDSIRRGDVSWRDVKRTVYDEFELEVVLA